MSFTLVQKVRWTSQAGSYSTTKEGVIFAVVPPNVPCREIEQKALAEYAMGPLGRVDAASCSSRKHESYIVLVRPADPKSKAKPKLYWPLVSKLEAVE